MYDLFTFRTTIIGDAETTQQRPHTIETYLIEVIDSLLMSIIAKKRENYEHLSHYFTDC